MSVRWHPLMSDEDSDFFLPVPQYPPGFKQEIREPHVTILAGNLFNSREDVAAFVERLRSQR